MAGGSWQLARNRPRVTFFAATPAKGDVLRADFVSLEGFRGSYSRQMARKNPRATSDAATLAKGEIQGLGAFAFGALHGIRVPERPKGDSSGLGSFPPLEPTTTYLPRNAPRGTAPNANLSPSARSTAHPPADAAECSKGDVFRHETTRGRRFEGRFRLLRRVPWHPSRADDIERPKGDRRCHEAGQGRGPTP